MLFLTKWTLQKDEVLKYRLYNDYAIHQTIYNLFPYEEKRTFLYTVISQNRNSLVLLVQSQKKPSPPSFGCFELKEIPDNFFDYKQYLFQVKFSPVVQALEGKVVPIKTEEDINKWLMTRQNCWGIFIDCDKILKVGDGKVIMKQKGNSKAVTISYVEITGILTVNDKGKFLETVISGIGRSKGFGFGLMQLKPILEEEKDGGK